MHSVIIAVEMPPEMAKETWLGFLGRIIPKIEKNPAVEQIADNVWQLSVQKSPAALGYLIAAAEDFRLIYRILPFDAEPQWLRGGPTPKTS